MLAIRWLCLDSIQKCLAMLSWEGGFLGSPVIIYIIWNAVSGNQLSSVFAPGKLCQWVGDFGTLYNLTVNCYHSLYLHFLFVTFLAGFFQEEDFLLDSACYSEMKDAGFFDADWD
ncbi:hypothetical protein QYF36_004112 [Acer negundo]|nr:hypothetical protein QYF36_004112 [Acer negundo]